MDRIGLCKLSVAGLPPVIIRIAFHTLAWREIPALHIENIVVEFGIWIGGWIALLGAASDFWGKPIGELLCERVRNKSNDTPAVTFRTAKGAIEVEAQDEIIQKLERASQEQRATVKDLIKLREQRETLKDLSHINEIDEQINALENILEDDIKRLNGLDPVPSTTTFKYRSIRRDAQSGRFVRRMLRDEYNKIKTSNLMRRLKSILLVIFVALIIRFARVETLKEEYLIIGLAVVICIVVVALFRWVFFTQPKRLQE